MISDEQVAQIRHLFHAEHWKIGTLATELRLHPDTVRRHRLTDPYLNFLRQTLQPYPRRRATRLFQRIRPRGYTGSITQLRRVVAELRPPRREAFLRLRTFPGEQAQAHWSHFGEVAIGRALWLEFFLDQSLENFLLGHVHAFSDWGGAPRSLETDNLRSVVSVAARPSTSTPASSNSRRTTISPNGRRGLAHTLFGDQLTRHGHEQMAVKAH